MSLDYQKLYFFRFLSFYKGILPPILAETPKRAVKVKTYSILQKVTAFQKL